MGQGIGKKKVLDSDITMGKRIDNMHLMVDKQPRKALRRGCGRA